jgi:oligopeptidase B
LSSERAGAPAGADADRAPLPPRPEPRPHPITAHGDTRVDEWYWLRERDDPAVMAHLEAENAYTAAMTAPTTGLRDRLYAEIVARIQETDLSVPTLRSGWWYYNRTVEGQQYPIHCRKPAPGRLPDILERPTDAEAVPGDEVVLLDQNELAEGHEFFALGGFEVSPDSRLLAYSTDTTGGERYTLRIRDVVTGVDRADTIPDTYYGLAWASDSATVFYTRPDEAMRPYQLWRHRVGTDPADDVCVHTEEDQRFFLHVHRDKDGSHLVCSLHSQVTSEMRVLRADRPEEAWETVEPRRQGIEYSIDHHRGRFLIVTNDGARNFRLMAAPDDDLGREAWTEVIPYDDAVKLDGVETFSDHVVLFERAGGLQRMRVMGPDGSLAEVELPEPVASVGGGLNPEYDDHVLRFAYTSMVTPQSVFDHDLRTGRRRLLKQQPVLGGYDPVRFRTERLWADSGDGTRVPVSVVYPADLKRDGRAPALVYGYGSYEHSVDPGFSSIRLSLLERGFVVAIAHVRGGGEMGRQWYDDGKLLNKRHTFEDFVAVTRMLVAEGWTSPERVVARGGSAGGLLMGAVANAAPELYRAIVAEVPFVDCLTTILDETLPLTVIEWEEWGNPKADPDVYRYMKSYSPYDNVAPRPYPAILATTGLNDPRVSYWEPAKWVLRLRENTTSGRPVLLKVEMGAGHMGPSGRYDAWRDEAFILAFVLDTLGIG